MTFVQQVSIIFTMEEMEQYTVTPASSVPLTGPAPASPAPASEEQINISFIGESAENLTINKGFRVTPSADASLKKLVHLAYVAHQKGMLPPGWMPDETLQAYINFSLNLAYDYLAKLYGYSK